MASNRLVAAGQAKAHTDDADSLVIFDTETTGFGDHDEIIQIAAINGNGKTLLNTYIRPQQNIRNSEYHGITDETVRDSPTFDLVYPRIVEIFANKLVVAYNYDYDARMLVQCCRRHGLAYPERRAFDCAMELYATFYGDWNDYRGNYKWQKLSAAMQRFGLKFEGNEHDALADCKATLAVLKKMAEWYEAHRPQ